MALRIHHVQQTSVTREHKNRTRHHVTNTPQKLDHIQEMVERDTIPDLSFISMDINHSMFIKYLL
jgi:hypothetical protein